MLNMQLERERTRNNNTKKAMAVLQYEVKHLFARLYVDTAAAASDMLEII